MTDERMFMMYAPYLPLRERASVNGWVVLPIAELDEAEYASERAQAGAPGLAMLYALDDSESRDAGAFVYRPSSGIGAEFTGDDVLTMHRALVVMALHGNPDPPRVEGDREFTRGGDTALTSDNALVYGHPIAPDGYVAAEYGAVARTLSGGYNVFRPREIRIRPPGDLYMPSHRRHLDGELADAVHRCITRDTDPARRLHRAIAWLDLAWRNAQSITPDMRIPTVRSGFEVLFNSGKTKVLYRALSDLLDPEGAPRTPRTWIDYRHHYNDDLTALQWWFVCFTLLRNRIAHGKPVPVESHRHDNHYQTDLGLVHLQRAIRATVIARGYPWLELDPETRRRYRIYRKQNIEPPCDPGPDPAA
jgi:hypothetical protein